MTEWILRRINVGIRISEKPFVIFGDLIPIYMCIL